MKQFSLSLFACVLCTVSAFSQDLAQYDLKGPVKSLVEKSFRAEPKDNTYVPVMSAWLNEMGSDNVVRFDEKGRHSYTALLTDGGAEYQEETYEYSGDLLLHRHSWYEETEYQYDASGLMTAALSNGDGLGTNVYYINANGKHTEIWSVSTEGDTLAHELVEYDANGNVVKQYAVPFSDDAFFGFEFTYEYDAEGRLIRESSLTEYSNSVQVMTYAKGRLVKKTVSTYSNGMLTDTDELMFNKKGLLAEKKLYQMPDPLSPNQLELIQTQTYSYTFDKKGNWTKMVIAVTEPIDEGKTTYYVVERTITYF